MVTAALIPELTQEHHPMLGTVAGASAANSVGGQVPSVISMRTLLTGGDIAALVAARR